jgi:NAD-dependent dihydropyrimidine dehydrogenase PreA subunit/mannose/fructose-specific phosphotransferase system component IIA
MGKKIVFCNCGSERIEQERLQTIKKNLIDSHSDLIIISDLCGASVLNQEKLKSVFSVDDEYVIIGCHSRALQLLLEKAGIKSGDYSVKFINFFESDNKDIFKEISSFGKGTDPAQKAEITEIGNPDGWPSWFPLIDYSRCTSCGQCSDFCLFGVYDKTEGKVNVVKPQECKINCPACARICPQTAIIFPKYKPGGAIGGSDVIDEISEQKRQAEDINNLLNGDIYSALEQRKHKRKSIIREEAMNKAIEERLKALNNLKSESR